MIQILGLRPYKDKKSNKIKQAEKFFEKEWRAESVSDLFRNIEDHIEKVPKNERWNLFYTVASCWEKKGRKMQNQSVYPFDIDGIDTYSYTDYVDPICNVLKVNPSEVGIIFSGNGLQILVESDQVISDTKEFDDYRETYNSVCQAINRTLKVLGMAGEADPSVWSPARLMRMPLTRNIKTPDTGYPHKDSDAKVKLINRMIITQKDWKLSDCLDDALYEESELSHDEAIPESVFSRFLSVDSEGVQEECRFLRNCKENPNDISEENWYKMLSVVSRLDQGRELCHEYSQGYKGYDPHETDSKVDQALANSRPRTCKNISKSFEGCYECPHYGYVKSPVMIKGEDFISTKKTGFRSIKLTQDGRPVPGPVEQEDLFREFKKEHDYICTESRMLYFWTGTHWEETSDTFLDSFVEDKVNPGPKNQDCFEFKSKVFRNNIVPRDFFEKTTFKRINVSNGVLDLRSGTPELLDHSMDYGFRNTLPYDYDPSAECPRFNEFMKEVTKNRVGLEKVLLEYAGYAISNDDCTAAKALIMIGDGCNGKSTFIDVLKNMVGKDAYSSISISGLKNEQQLALLEGKLFNVMEETPKKAFTESSLFKNLVSGGDISIKRIYKTPYVIANRAKIIMACNELPPTYDTTDGMIRRMLIVPFDANFLGKEDYSISKKLQKEMSGIINRAIAAYREMLDRGGFTRESNVIQQLADYRLSNDPVLSFFADCVRVRGSGDISYEKDVKNRFPESTSLKQLYRSYRVYCEDNGIRYIESKPQFSKRLPKIVPNFEYRKRRAGKNKETVYHGISFLEQDIDEDVF